MVHGQRAELTLAGDLGAGVLRELEEQLDDPRLRAAREWVVDMSEVTRLDLACAYALLRAAVERPEAVRLVVHGARREVRRTLRQAGIGPGQVSRG
ncbi:STAS domain-containing protein [Streptomyces oryzae]|uniref:STAS domain-containing protein n=1 Tax=Streptomyces oryzae TaxID=1434886 RepID=A0ABS3X7X8_9ACTN|nr:STAS domain-containing protein [Streptomyces oryzae]MBO8191477.1 STAS domain-containing protein [Streptomyces oryzae]